MKIHYLSRNANRTSFIHDPVTNTTTASIPNTPFKEHIGITVELKDGDIGLMSSTSDIVESVCFVATTMSSIPTTANAIEFTKPVLDLVVPIGETVYMRDPYRYRSILIEGTSMVSTGKLVWVKNDIVNEYFYNDLLITRNTVMPVPVLGAPERVYNNIIVLADASLTVM